MLVPFIGIGEEAMNKTLGAGIGALMISSSAMAGVVINEGDAYSPDDITNGTVIFGTTETLLIDDTLIEGDLPNFDYRAMVDNWGFTYDGTFSEITVTFLQGTGRYFWGIYDGPLISDNLLSTPPNPAERDPESFVGPGETFLGASNPSISFDLADLGLIPGDSSSVALTDFALDLTADEFNHSYKIEFGQISAVPVPAAVWLFGTALAGFAGFRAKQRKLA